MVRAGRAREGGMSLAQKANERGALLVDDGKTVALVWCALRPLTYALDVKRRHYIESASRVRVRDSVFEIVGTRTAREPDWITLIVVPVGETI